MPRFVCLLLLLLLFPAPARAQNVRRDSLTGWGSQIRKFERMADEAGRTDWPSPRDGKPGTAVRITFDARNADVTLVTARSFGVDRLLGIAKSIGARMNLPQADFIVVEGRTYAAVDIELNDYLRRSPLRSQFELDLGALSGALAATDLPQPVVMGAEKDPEVRLSTPTGSRQLESAWFAAPSEVTAGSRISTDYQVSWRIIPGLLFFVSMLIAPLLFLFRKGKPDAQPVPPPSPEEVQARYDRSAPMWVLTLGLIAIPILLFGFMNPTRMFSELDLLLPFESSFLMIGIAGLTGLGLLGGVLKRRKNAEKAPAAEPAPGEASPEDLPPAWARFGWLTVLMVGMLGMPIWLLIPVYTPAQQQMMRYGLFAWMGLIPIAAVIVGVAALRASRVELKDGPWFDTVCELAARGKVPVRHVVLTRSPIANAWATPLGTVSMTTALVRQLSGDELRAVIAHELGHLKLRHPQRTVVVSLLSTLVICAAWYGMRELMGDRMSTELRVLLNGPLVFIVAVPMIRMLLMGRGMRIREEQADRLAVEWTGQPEVLVQALERLHLLAATPGRLKASDEALSTHPSLVRRVEAIRRSSAKA